MNTSVHGGDVYRNNVRLDFSVNINPMGVDAQIKNKLNISMDEITHYPRIISYVEMVHRNLLWQRCMPFAHAK